MKKSRCYLSWHFNGPEENFWCFVVLSVNCQYESYVVTVWLSKLWECSGFRHSVGTERVLGLLWRLRCGSSPSKVPLRLAIIWCIKCCVGHMDCASVFYWKECMEVVCYKVESGAACC